MVSGFAIGSLSTYLIWRPGVLYDPGEGWSIPLVANAQGYANSAPKGPSCQKL
jgi:hypothetical protein